MKELGYKAIVFGTVQRVGFRYFTAKQAKQLKVTGHAKNLSDGTVEVLMFGPELQLRNLLKWLEIGPQMSSVVDVKVTAIPFSVKTGFSCY